MFSIENLLNKVGVDENRVGASGGMLREIVYFRGVVFLLLYHLFKRVDTFFRLGIRVHCLIMAF